MADRLFTSAESAELIKLLSFGTQLEFGTLARLAISYSLVHFGKEVALSGDFSGKEIRDQSIFGKDESLFRSMVNFVHKRHLDGDEFMGKRSVCKDHVDAGLKALFEIFKECGEDGQLFLYRIAESIAEGNKDQVPAKIAGMTLNLGTDKSNGEALDFEINNGFRHSNSHIGIVGKPGVGKTQLMLKLLSEIRERSELQTHFIAFDYKGDIAENREFVSEVKARIFRSAEERIPVNPFILDDYTESQIMISAREKAESFGSISPRFGMVQTQYLTSAIHEAYKARQASSCHYPDFAEVQACLEKAYSTDGKGPDTLTQILKDLSNFQLFWKHGEDSTPWDSLLDKTLIIDLHKLPVLKELVVYLIIERLYKEIAAMPDSNVSNGIRELRTIVVIDEAHNYLGQRNIFLQKLIREGRSKGVAVFFASQSPNDYDQKYFDFKELLELLIVFQCDGVSPSVIQDLIGCSPRVAKDLQSEIARLQPRHAITRAYVPGRDYSLIKTAAFYDRNSK